MVVIQPLSTRLITPNFDVSLWSVCACVYFLELSQILFSFKFIHTFSDYIFFNIARNQIYTRLRHVTQENI